MTQPVWKANERELVKNMAKTKKQRITKTKAWKEPNLEEIYQTTLDHKNVDMMGSFYGTKAMKLVKSEFFMNPYKKLSAIVE